MYLKASSDFQKLAEKAETTLRSLGFEFIRNRADQLIEFEINEPAYFRIVIETRKDAIVHNFLLPSISAAKGCTMDIRYGLDAGEKEIAIAALTATTFLKALVDALEQKPWEGLRMRESSKEKKKWKEALG